MTIQEAEDKIKLARKTKRITSSKYIELMCKLRARNNELKIAAKTPEQIFDMSKGLEHYLDM